MIAILKYSIIGLLGLLVLAAVIASPFIIRARTEAERLFAKYAGYTEDVLSRQVSLQPYPVKPEYQVLHPWKFLKLFRIAVNSRSGDKLARVNTLDATMFMFMKMYTMFIRPDYGYNLPMLSVDFIFMGGKRIFIIEVIDPAKMHDENLAVHYERMRSWMPKIEGFEEFGVRDWYKEFVTDFSIHIKADRTHDDMLFEIYTSYLNSYMDMVANAVAIDAEQSAQVRSGIERYVTTLLEQGGPAVDVFRQMLGSEGQQEYVRTVMFGLDR
jgi:hypothetical protein